MRHPLLLASLLLGPMACSNEGNVFTSMPADAAVHPDAAVAPDAVPSDSGAADAQPPPADGGVAEDASTPEDSGQPVQEWASLPGLIGGQFRHVGDRDDHTYLVGRNYSDRDFSLYRLEAGGSSQKLGRTVDANDRAFNLPTGALVELGSRLLWATDSDGVIVSEDDGQTFKYLPIPWQDGSVGAGNGHVSRLVGAWDTGDQFCVHREVTPWVNFQVLSEQLHGEVRCLDAADHWTVTTSSLAEGMRFFTPFGEELYGFTAPLYNLDHPAKLCRSFDLGAQWECFPTELQEGSIFRLASGRLVVRRWVDSAGPPAGTYSELWYSDDFGETWTLGLTIPYPLTEMTVVGDLIYGLGYFVDTVDELYVVDLSVPGYTTVPRPTLAHVYWLDLFALGGAFHFADTRGVHRFDAANQRFDDVGLELMPAIDISTDRQGNVWAVDGTRTARRLRTGATLFEELFFDDTGWGTGNILDYASVLRLQRVDDRVYFGAGHAKIYSVDASTTSTVGQEDLTLVSLLHPDAAVWRLASEGTNLYAAATGGAEQNHGTGVSYPWGGGLFKKDTLTGQWTSVTGGLPQRLVDLTLGDAIVGALYAGDGLLVAATHAGVHRSTDRGMSWRPVTGIPAYDASSEATSIAGEGTHVLLARAAGGASALYFSSDGTNFVGVAGNLPRGEVRDLAAEGDKFYALLDSAGVFASADQGVSWTAVGALPAGATFPPRAYSLHVEPARILAGTNLGVWQLMR